MVFFQQDEKKECCPCPCFNKINIGDEEADSTLVADQGTFDIDWKSDTLFDVMEKHSRKNVQKFQFEKTKTLDGNRYQGIFPRAETECNQVNRRILSIRYWDVNTLSNVTLRAFAHVTEELSNILQFVRFSATPPTLALNGKSPAEVAKEVSVVKVVGIKVPKVQVPDANGKLGGCVIL